MGEITHKDAADMETAHRVSEEEWKASTTHLDSQGNTLELARSATLIVAGANASAKSKAGANYVSNGTEDDVDIQAALDALTSGRTWKEIVKCVGDFSISAKLEIPSYTILDLSESIITLAASAEDHIINISATNDIEIIGGIIDGNKDNQAASALDGLTIWHASSNIIVKGMTISDVKRNGIITWTDGAYNEDNVVVDKCTVETCGGSGILFNSTTRYSKITNCYVGECDLQNICIYGEHCSASDTISYDPGAQYDCFNVQGTENVLTNCHAIGDGAAAQQEGFALHAGDGHQIVNCTARNLLGRGVFVLDSDDCSIIGCRIYTCTQSGIEVHGSTATGTQKTSIIGNKLYSCTIDVPTWDRTGYYNNTDIVISNNQIDKGTILVQSATDVVISNNIVQSDQYNGIYVTKQSGESDNTSVSITGNRCYKQSTISANNYGLNVDYVDYLTVIGNDFTGNDDGAVSYGANSTYVDIQSNKGYVTENDGTSSITSGQTTKVVAHGLTTTPTVINISITEQGTNDYGRWWVDTVGATNFTLNVSADPGASNLDFWWEAKIR